MDDLLALVTLTALPFLSEAALGQAESKTDPSAFTLDTPLLPAVVVTGEPLPPAEERTLARRMQALNVPGLSVAVLREGELAWADGYGVTDVESGRPVGTRTLFQAASISKPLAATGALRLVQEGRLTLDGDVNEVLEGWKVPASELTDPEGGERRPVTLRDLLSHTAGTTVSGFPGYAAGEEVPDTIGVLEGLGNTPPVRVELVPGTQRQYSGGGYTIVQLLVDELAGEQSYAAWMEENVLRPLGMRDSCFAQPPTGDVAARAARAHTADGSPIEGGWHTYPELAAAGMWTTPTDLVRFAAMVQRGVAGEDGPVLEARFVQAMCEEPVEPGYGLGLSLGPDRFGHGGGNEGFICSLTVFFEGGGAALMTNSSSGWDLGQEVMRTIFEREGWEGLEPIEKTVVELSTERLAALAGTYRFEGYGDLVLSVADSGDRLDFALFSGERGQLRPEGPTTFFDTEDGTVLSFTLEEDSGRGVAVEWDGYRAERVD